MSLSIFSFNSAICRWFARMRSRFSVVIFVKASMLLAVLDDRLRQTQQRRFKTIHFIEDLVLRVLQYLVFPLHALESNIGCGCHAVPIRSHPV